MTIYGFYHGGDPRDFTPDAECCSERELEAHKAACKLWDDCLSRGVTPTPEACQSGWRTLPDGKWRLINDEPNHEPEYPDNATKVSHITEPLGILKSPLDPVTSKAKAS